MTNSY